MWNNFLMWKQVLTERCFPAPCTWRTLLREWVPMSHRGCSSPDRAESQFLCCLSHHTGSLQRDRFALPWRKQTGEARLFYCSSQASHADPIWLYAGCFPGAGPWSNPSGSAGRRWEVTYLPFLWFVSTSSTDGAWLYCTPDFDVTDFKAAFEWNHGIPGWEGPQGSPGQTFLGTSTI